MTTLLWLRWLLLRVSNQKKKLSSKLNERKNEILCIPMYEMMNKLIGVIQVYHVWHYKLDFTSWEYHISNYMIVHVVCTHVTYACIQNLSHLYVKREWGQQISFIRGDICLNPECLVGNTSNASWATRLLVQCMNILNVTKVIKDRWQNTQFSHNKSLLFNPN